jgi:hypothetical protein
LITSLKRFFSQQGHTHRFPGFDEDIFGGIFFFDLAQCLFFHLSKLRAKKVSQTLSFSSPGAQSPAHGGGLWLLKLTQEMNLHSSISVIFMKLSSGLEWQSAAGKGIGELTGSRKQETPRSDRYILAHLESSSPEIRPAVPQNEARLSSNWRTCGCPEPSS